ncbi:MAG: hypothetical protein ACLFP6_12725, partial [Spirochaetaceae bacterium]
MSSGRGPRKAVSNATLLVLVIAGGLSLLGCFGQRGGNASEVSQSATTGETVRIGFSMATDTFIIER